MLALSLGLRVSLPSLWPRHPARACATAVEVTSHLVVGGQGRRVWNRPSPWGAKTTPLEPVLKGHGRCRTGGWRAGGAARGLKAGPAQAALPAASPVGVVELFCPQRTVLDEKRKEKPQEGLRGWSAWPQALGSVGLFAAGVERGGESKFPRRGGEPALQEEQKTALLQGRGS